MNFNYFIHVIFFLSLIQWVSSSSMISAGVFDEHQASSRSLLQVQKECKEDFENKDYTIITDKCKGPQYPAEQCCKALKEFACPLRNVINDMENNCAATMFSYINTKGGFPPGLFAHKCVEGKEGLECKDPVPPPPAAGAAADPSTSLLLTAGFLVLLIPLMM